MGGNERARRMSTYFKKKFKTDNPFEVAAYLNIVLTEKPLDNLAGCYMYIHRLRVIMLNSDIEDQSFRKIVMAHELGHAILHKTENCCFIKNQTLFLTSRLERQANIFAAEFLISDNILFDYAGYNIQQIALAEGLNEELLNLKFNL